jgi:hypothetical protein
MSEAMDRANFEKYEKSSKKVRRGSMNHFRSSKKYGGVVRKKYGGFRSSKRSVPMSIMTKMPFDKVPRQVYKKYNTLQKKLKYELSMRLPAMMLRVHATTVVAQTRSN